MSTPLSSRRRSFNLISKSDPKSQRAQNRRSLAGFSPSPAGESPQLPNVLNEEDEKERRVKRRSRTLAQATSSPHARPGVEDLGETAKLTNDQLATHYVNCIKLSTENKITAKNAFNLHLIDHMNEMLKQRCEGTLNFQMAGGTIFASAKIYASRVDAVHSEAYKVLSSLGRGTEDEAKQKSDDESEFADDLKKETTKKKKKRSKILESNPAVLRLKKMDVCWQTDPLDQYYSSKFDTSCTSGLLINNLSLCKDGITMRFDSDMESPFSHNAFGSVAPATEPEEPQAAETETVEDKKQEIDGVFFDLLNLTSKESVKKSQLCPTISSFNWNKAADDSFEWPQNRMSVSDDEDVPVQAIIESTDDVMMDHHGFGTDDECDTDPTKSEPPESNGPFPVSMDAELITSFMPGEYSYFKHGAFSTWEGPNHWKMRTRPKVPVAPANEAGKNTDGEKAAKGKKRKRAYVLSYPNVTVDPKEFERAKRSSVVTKRIQEKWAKCEEDRLLPAAGEYNVLHLAKCVLQPDIQIRPVTLIHGTKKEFPMPSVDPDTLAPYNYDNLNDKNNYCPNMTDDEEDTGEAMDGLGPLPSDFNTNYNSMEHMEGFPDVTMSQTQNMSQTHFSIEAMLQGDHLVSHPKKVEKISIAYAKKATRIDVRRLKAAMWTLLHKPEDDNSSTIEKALEELDTTVPNGTAVADEMSDVQSNLSDEHKFFSTMYSTLPKLVPATMAENLSIPLAFTCLLHLANEKSLKIEAMPDMSDLNIIEPMDEM